MSADVCEYLELAPIVYRTERLESTVTSILLRRCTKDCQRPHGTVSSSTSSDVRKPSVSSSNLLISLEQSRGLHTRNKQDTSHCEVALYLISGTYLGTKRSLDITSSPLSPDNRNRSLVLRSRKVITLQTRLRGKHAILCQEFVYVEQTCRHLVRGRAFTLHQSSHGCEHRQWACPALALFIDRTARGPVQ